MTSFLTPVAKEFKSYSTVPKDGKVLEVGCCFGTEIRGLLQDGFAPENITALDITNGYWNLGKTIYGDEPEGVPVIFTDLAADEDSASASLSALYGTRDLVIASKLLIHMAFSLAEIDRTSGCLSRIDRETSGKYGRTHLEAVQAWRQIHRYLSW